MATKYYRDIGNKYVGAFDGAEPPLGSVEVPFPPAHGLAEWDGAKWVEPIALKNKIIDEKREFEVIKQGVSLEDQVRALWDNVKGDSKEFDRIDAIVEKAKVDHPKS